MNRVIDRTVGKSSEIGVVEIFDDYFKCVDHDIIILS